MCVLLTKISPWTDILLKLYSNRSTGLHFPIVACGSRCIRNCRLPSAYAWANILFQWFPNNRIRLHFPLRACWSQCTRGSRLHEQQGNKDRHWENVCCARKGILEPALFSKYVQIVAYACIFPYGLAQSPSATQIVIGRMCVAPTRISLGQHLFAMIPKASHMLAFFRMCLLAALHPRFQAPWAAGKWKSSLGDCVLCSKGYPRTSILLIILANSSICSHFPIRACWSRGMLNCSLYHQQ